jgi:hypothetical protein
MFDFYGMFDEAAARGQSSQPESGYAPPANLQDAIRAREAAARAGEGTVDQYFQGGSSHQTGSQFRGSTDPRDVALYQQLLQSGRSDPNLLFGAADGSMSQGEKDYRSQYRSFMENPNEGVDTSEALRALGMFGAVALGGGALAQMGAGTGTGAAAGTSATGAGAGTGVGTGGIGAGFGTNAGGLGYFANGGAAGLAGLGGGNAGALAASGAIAGGAGALGGGMLGTLTEYGGKLGSLMGGMEQPQQQMPQMPNITMQAPQQGLLGPTPMQPPVLPGVPQGPFQGFSRKPFQFAGQTIWM